MHKSTIFAFVFGAACGAGGAWYFLKTKYERYAQEEIDSVKERFSKPIQPYKGPQDAAEAQRLKEKPDISTFARVKNDYSKVLNRESYAGKAPEEEESKEEEALDLRYSTYTGAKTGNAEDKPYVISPDEFGEFDEYTKISLTYFADHILTDETLEMVEDIEDVVGFESLTHFGEYEDDSVFVRNDRLRVDYEILKDLRNYADVVKDKPYLRRD